MIIEVNIEKVSISFKSWNVYGCIFMFKYKNNINRRNTTKACVIVPATSRKTAMKIIIIFLSMLIDSQKYHFFLYPLYKNPYCSRHGISSSLFLLLDSKTHDKIGIPNHHITILGTATNKIYLKCSPFHQTIFKS